MNLETLFRQNQTLELNANETAVVVKDFEGIIEAVITNKNTGEKKTVFISGNNYFNTHEEAFNFDRR